MKTPHASALAATAAVAITLSLATPALAAGPFDAPSTLPYQLPPFGQVHDSDFLPAFEAGMAEQRREVDAIAHDAAPPTFTNTLVALERSGRLLDRVRRVFGNLSSSNTNPVMQQLEKELAPKLSAHSDAIQLDPALFARIDALWKTRDTLGLDGEQQSLLERYHTRFVRAGANLAEGDKAKLRALNAEISTLTTKFRQNVLAATREGAVLVSSEAELDGMSPAQVAAARAAAERRGHPGQWLIALQNTTIQPSLAVLKDRALRERIYQASSTRATSGPYDNTPVVSRIAELRAERAKLLGYATHADYVLADESAGTPAAVHAMLTQVGAPAQAQARREATDLQAAINAEAKAQGKPAFTLKPWDWAYYAEQVRKAHYDFDESQVKPYFELDRVLKDGVFHAAHELFGITFTERPDLKAYRDDVRVFEVRNADGTPLALFLGDYFARDNKNGGAWSSTFVDQSQLMGTLPVVVNNLNIVSPAPGQPVLLTFDEVTTLFHEFGHALHSMLSNVEYPSLSGARGVPRDFVEFPSQYNEMWAHEPVVLSHYARHYQTGEPMPADLMKKVLAARDYGEGFATSEYIAASMLDQAWYTLKAGQVPEGPKVMAFEQKALAGFGFEQAGVPPRYHSTYFAHIFDGGYSSGYYAYLWSEVLARDTGKWFHAHGGLSRANGEYLRAKVLSRGRTMEPGRLFREFYGQDPDIGPLLEYRGLSAAPAATKRAAPKRAAPAKP